MSELKIFQFSLDYLLENAQGKKIALEKVMAMMKPKVTKDLKEVYQRMLESMANRNMMANVIGFLRNKCH